MRVGIPMLGNRVAPRCTIADRLVVITIARNQVRAQKTLSLGERNWDGLLAMLLQTQVDTLICGGISGTWKDEVREKRIAVIDNIIGTLDTAVSALTQSEQPYSSAGSTPSIIDCLKCQDRVCLRGESCDAAVHALSGTPDNTALRLIDAAMDVALENDRILCRMSELIYFCLEMKYRHVGLAFCSDLLEPAEILTAVLRRFFTVTPACCKIGGIQLNDPLVEHESTDFNRERDQVACNPLGLANVLNRASTDLNVTVGLCVGIDSLFTKHSNAPVSTLIVKDKSLANNPVGALYSDYYLREAQASEPLVGTDR
ncbi:MAG: DUF1847 domain-containing protein [candidate division Zixibacteria bacterium]|nr:DUF1847 domain-containing protein [candidate division Zixibacteria bacterium]